MEAKIKRRIGKFFVKVHIVIVLAFVGHLVSVIATQVYYSKKAALENM
jgi:hypothetical protein